MKLLTNLTLLLIFLSPLHGVYADTTGEASAGTMDILIEKVSADKKLLVATNMSMTDKEADAFWPVYEDYQQDLASINQRIVGLIQRYAEVYRTDTLTEELAAGFTEEMLEIQQAEVDLNKSYVPKFEQVLSKIKVARYIQIENKLRAIVKYGLAERVPLVY